jgi:endonuclease G
MESDDNMRLRRYRERVAASHDRIISNQRLISQKRWQEIEEKQDRRIRYQERRARLRKTGGREALQGDTNDLQGVSFLPEGARRRRAVAFIEAPDGSKINNGSGFLISPRLFMTNQHVIGDASIAAATALIFDREYGENGKSMPTTTYSLAPERFALFSPEEELDYALIAIGDRMSGEASISEFGYCPISREPDRHVLGMAVNIIQHPGAMPKMIALRNNRLHDRTETTLLYETDTQQGSSGSPVFNDDWDLVALHHYGEPFRALKDETGRTIPINMNEGIRISAIYKDLEARLGELGGEPRLLIEEALDLHRRDAAQNGGGLRLGGPRPTPDPQPQRNREAIGVEPGETREIAMTNGGSGEMRVTIPIEVTIRVGAAGAPVAIAAEGPAPTAASPARTLSSGAERLKVDADYANRGGYDPAFIPGVKIPLPAIGAKLKDAVAPLRADQANAEAGELKYQHFSLKMNKLKRVAIFTATNIDGETYLNVDRDSGQVVGGAEGESWIRDPRISPNYTLNQDFYSAWSIYFDRGHLTRRTDPTWGDDASAERANADTFHFSNCAPQHFRFNQTTDYWQGAERYVLEKGATATQEGRKISVFQGPIYDDAIDRYADDTQIPSSFFKIIVWKGKGKVKSVGLIVDQIALLDEQRRGLKRPTDETPINVSQWRVPIATIEQRTGLDFGKTIRDADTINASNQPKVGERMVRLASLEALLD